MDLYRITTAHNETTVRPTATLWSSTVINNSTQQQVNYCAKPLNSSFENVAYAIFMTVLLLASFVGNSLVILATILSKQLQRRVTVYLIVSLGMLN